MSWTYDAILGFSNGSLKGKILVFYTSINKTTIFIVTFKHFFLNTYLFGHYRFTDRIR